MDDSNLKVNVLPARSSRPLQSASGEELSALIPSLSVANGMPSILDKAFKGEL